ncbi:hypothetical protein GCM10011359_30890 [Nesterenkonia alkaliphila]|nr:hypothetical protein GCM10011359_30890 [Nesterenkonia alkaliphila]
MFNVFMVLVAIASIILTVPKDKVQEAQRGKDVAPPPIGN